MIRYKAYLVILCFLLNLEYSHEHTCSHVVPKPNEVVHNVHIEPHHLMRKRSIDQRLRIHLDYDASISALPANKQKLVKTDLIPSAVAFWESTLQVRNTTGPIKLLRQCETERVRYKDGDPYPYCVDGCKKVTKCGESTVPEKHLEVCRIAPIGEEYKTQGYGGTGIDSTDFILYISAYETPRCGIGTTVAYSAYCQLEGAMDRPVAGYVNLCPNSISTLQHEMHQMHSTIKHEILHALGFSAGLYAFYRDQNGDVLTERAKSTGKPAFNESKQLYQWSDRVLRTVTRDSWGTRGGNIQKTINMIITPNVVKHVREHFNCSSLEGAELEDQGVLGTSLTHWEKRVFENEVMTGTYTQNPLISKITLALMEDTGWYRVDYSKAEPLKWGKNLGCDFVMKSCHDWIKLKRKNKQHIHPYCDRPKRGVLQTECTEERDAVALCNLVALPEPVLPQYQYFDYLPGVPQEELPYYGGAVLLADYCPYIQEFNWRKGDDIVRGSRCDIEQHFEKNEVNYMLETYGLSTRCFDHVDPWTLKHCKDDQALSHWGSGCYKYKCHEKLGLVIIAGAREYRCYQEGQVIDIYSVSDQLLHIGNIVCPSCTEICQPEGVSCPAEVTPPQRSVTKEIEAPCSESPGGHSKSIFLGAILQIIILWILSF